MKIRFKTPKALEIPLKLDQNKHYWCIGSIEKAFFLIYLEKYFLAPYLEKWP